jgi:ubiquinone/menaquinone biosynthesis C-methylase UbiE
MNQTTMSPIRIQLLNWVHRSFLKRLYVKGFYNKFNKFLSDEETLMNWGYAPLDANAKQLELSEKDNARRYPLQMYYSVASAVDIAGKSILEVGSGRGGGADFLVRSLQPKSYIGLDLSEENVAFCNKTFARNGLRFQRGDAQNLPFPEAQFDRVVNVESSHCYPKPELFLQEVFRVLKPGGYFLMSDFRDTAETIPPSTESKTTLLAQIKQAGFDIHVFEDITPNVLIALNQEHERKLAVFNKLSQKINNDKDLETVKWVMALKDGPIYKNFNDGDKCYMRFVCQKPIQQMH